MDRIKVSSINFLTIRNTKTFLDGNLLNLLNLRFNTLRHTALHSKVVSVFEQKLNSLINVKDNKSNKSFIINDWTSIEGKSYYVIARIAAHFINDD